jgi:hypothetical protein
MNIVAMDFPTTCSSHLGLLVWVGSRLTVFYRKRFDLSRDARPVSDFATLSLMILISVLDRRRLNELGFLLIALEMRLRLSTAQEILKASSLSFSMYLAISGTVPVLTWTALCIMATTQLLRWPPALKHYLRNLRTVCGPSYAILVAGATFQETLLLSTASDEGSSSYETLVRFLYYPSLLKVAAFCSSVASIMFRPDNDQIWLLVPYLTSLKECGWIPHERNHKLIHASLMLLSLLCMIVKFYKLGFEPPIRRLGEVLIGLSIVGLVFGVESIRSNVLSRFEFLKLKA